MHLVALTGWWVLEKKNDYFQFLLFFNSWNQASPSFKSPFSSRFYQDLMLNSELLWVSLLLFAAPPPGGVVASKAQCWSRIIFTLSQNSEIVLFIYFFPGANVLFSFFFLSFLYFQKDDVLHQVNVSDLETIGVNHFEEGLSGPSTSHNKSHFKLLCCVFLTQICWSRRCFHQTSS